MPTDRVRLRPAFTGVAARLLHVSGGGDASDSLGLVGATISGHPPQVVLI
jgi:hypothetical protein